MFVLLAACTQAPDDTASTVPDDSEAASVGLSSVWAPEGEAWDLVAQEGVLYSTTQFGGRIWGWQPEDGTEIEVGDRLGEVQAMDFGPDGALYFSFTDSGQLGGVARLDAVRSYTVLVEAGDGGKPMRRPEDLIVASSGRIYAADPGAMALWEISADFTSALPVVKDAEVLSVTEAEGTILYGTPEGTFDLEDGLLFEGETRGLLAVEGSLYRATPGGIYRGDELLPGSADLPRPGSMAWVGETLYVADQSQGEVWR